MHAQKNKIPPMIPSDKPILGPAPIINNFTLQPIQPPVRQEFMPVPAPQPIVHPTITPNPPPLFASVGKNRFMHYTFCYTNFTKSVETLEVRIFFLNAKVSEI